MPTVPPTMDAAPAEELAMLAQALQAADAARLPLSRSLTGMGANDLPGRVGEWVRTLSLRMEQGHPLGDSVASLPGIDPLLVALLSVPGGKGLSSLLSVYCGHLVRFHRLAETLRTALFYPLIVLGLAMANLWALNTFLFPAFQLHYPGGPATFPVSMSLLYCAHVGTWPLSWFIPGFLAITLILGIQTCFLMPVSRMPRSPFGRLFGLLTFDQAEREGRFQSLVHLFLTAGKPLPEALELAARHGELHDAEPVVMRIVEALKRGETPQSVFPHWSGLALLAEGWPEDGRASLVHDRFQMAAAANLAAAMRRLGTTEFLGFIGGLFFAGGVVLVLTLAFFHPYFNLIGGGT